MKQAYYHKAYRHRPLKKLITVLTAMLALAAGCAAQRGAGNPDGPTKGQRSVVYPSGDAINFPEDQVIKKPLQATTQWQTVTFEKPLQINLQGTMCLQLAVDVASYISPLDDHPLNSKCNTLECFQNSSGLRRLSDGALVRIEAVLIGDYGEQIRVQPVAYLYPYFDLSVMTVILGYAKDVNFRALPFPDGIRTITAMRIRSTEPFLVRYLWWGVLYEHSDSNE